jgi:hypothetical protein
VVTPNERSDVWPRPPRNEVAAADPERVGAHAVLCRSRGFLYDPGGVVQAGPPD